MTTNSDFDYTSLLPGGLESTLQTLTKVYQANADQLNNAYLYTVLPGVYTSARTFYQITLPILFSKISFHFLLSQHRACERYPISSRVSLVPVPSQLHFLRQLDRLSYPCYHRQGCSGIHSPPRGVGVAAIGRLRSSCIKQGLCITIWKDTRAD